MATTSFNSSFRTIVTANMASLIGAVLLYLLTVGSIRGFALFLAIGTVLDMIASYWFMRPMALYLARSRRWADRPRWLGMAAPRGGAAMSVLRRMTSYDDDIDFRKVWRVGTTMSLCVLLACILGIVFRDLDLGIDFEGGTSWEVPSETLSVDDARDALEPTGAGRRQGPGHRPG